MKIRLPKKIIFILCLLFLHFFAQSQSAEEVDITGLWKGELYNDTTKKYLPYEIAISEEKGKLMGYSYISFQFDGKEEIGIKRIKMKRKDEKLFIEDVEFVTNNYSEQPPKGIKWLGEVSISMNDSMMQLKGYWQTSRAKGYSSVTGSILLQRAINYRAQILFKKLQALHLDDNLSFVKAQKKSEQDIARLNLTKIEAETSNNSPAANEPDKANLAKSVAVIAAPKKQPVPDKPTVTPPPVQEKKPEISVAKTASAKKEIIPAEVADKKNVENKQAPVVARNEPSKEIVKKPDPPVKQANPVATAPVKITPSEKIIPAPHASTEIVKATESKKTAEMPEPQVKDVAIKSAQILSIVHASPSAAANVTERKVNNTQEVFYLSDSLILSLYDNGEVDGDTVSVLLNGKIIFARQGLTTKANNKTIYITEDMPDSLLLVMYAENLGSIPPNTGLLVVRDGEAVYDVRFRADLQSNAAIILRKKKKVLKQ